ncbi:BLUF domain-containing protein [Roseibium porphyridii]|uniref:BLUF domain-containing protein n=1 Tax=Roseibium porphyridii TaxID=2866279 RepID=A0ABY8EY08_9HYPH|nr:MULTISPECIES: BLUF domain-containing protein [Stappiaceae]QFT32549.1 Sensors of blue-light using FAD [Labrenzia sp. THAF82]WFE87880.1 BLUF domain-containing protein [Roseibium sp. KMA01]
MELYRACYRSQIRWNKMHLPLPDEIDKTLLRIRRINRKAGVTGALLLVDQHIVQILEGQTGQVLDTVYCVMNDPRLESIEGIIHEPVDFRMFPNSLMFFRDLSDGVAASQHDVLRPLLDHPGDVTREEAYAAFGHFAKELQEGRLTNDMLMI